MLMITFKTVTITNSTTNWKILINLITSLKATPPINPISLTPTIITPTSLIPSPIVSLSLTPNLINLAAIIILFLLLNLQFTISLYYQTSNEITFLAASPLQFITNGVYHLKP